MTAPGDEDSYDEFGMNPRAVRRALAWARPLHERWFRVLSDGVEHIPRAGGAILVGNHAGVLPLDAAMIWTDVLLHTGRVVRHVADRFVPSLPFVSSAMARVGVVAGCRENVHHLLASGELLMIFPEGTVGIGKPQSERYHLQRWRVGHAEMAIAHRVPVIPVAIVGAEEQFPLLARLDLHPFGVPFLPVGVPVLLPVRYHVRYGAPIDLGATGPTGVAPSADDTDHVAVAAERVCSTVARLVAELRAERKGWFA